MSFCNLLAYNILHDIIEKREAQMIDIRKVIVMTLLGLLLQCRSVSAQPKGFNYDESKVPKYSLPDPLTLLSGCNARS